VIDKCGGYRGKECGEAVNFYKHLEEIIERDKKLESEKAVEK
jgi:hypothetical protein